MGNKDSSLATPQKTAHQTLSENDQVEPLLISEHKKEVPKIRMSSNVGVDTVLPIEKQKMLLDQAISELENRLSERKYPYKLVVKFNADGTRASITMKRGNIFILGWTFIVGACILGIIVQRCLYPWFRWNLFAEVDSNGRITMKFHNARGRIALCLTCILTSCVLAYFSNEEYKSVRQSTFDAMQDSAKEFFAAENLNCGAPTVTDKSKDNLKDFFVENDEVDESDFLNEGMGVNNVSNAV